MTEESRKEKKRLEKKLKVIKARIAKLEQEKFDLLQAIYLLRGECYRCWYAHQDKECTCGARAKAVSNV
jgi:hypothetical protein